MKSDVNQQSREHCWICARKDHAEKASRLPADAQGSFSFRASNSFRLVLLTLLHDCRWVMRDKFRMDSVYFSLLQDTYVSLYCMKFDNLKKVRHFKDLHYSFQKRIFFLNSFSFFLSSDQSKVVLFFLYFFFYKIMQFLSIAIIYWPHVIVTIRANVHMQIIIYYA